MTISASCGAPVTTPASASRVSSPAARLRMTRSRTKWSSAVAADRRRARSRRRLGLVQEAAQVVVRNGREGFGGGRPDVGVAVHQHREQRPEAVVVLERKQAPRGEEPQFTGRVRGSHERDQVLRLGEVVRARDSARAADARGLALRQARPAREVRARPGRRCPAARARGRRRVTRTPPAFPSSAGNHRALRTAASFRGAISPEKIVWPSAETSVQESCSNSSTSETPAAGGGLDSGGAVRPRAGWLAGAGAGAGETETFLNDTGGELARDDRSRGAAAAFRARDQPEQQEDRRRR